MGRVETMRHTLVEILDERALGHAKYETLEKIEKKKSLSYKQIGNSSNISFKM
jgi:hypothetical protein